MNTYNGHDPSIHTLFSEDRVYRYLWVKQVIPGNPRICLFLMLNPSTADEFGPDPTVAKCIKFARKWDYGVLIVVNLFALRSTDPTNLKRVVDPVGPANDFYIRAMALKAQHAICAWGNHGALNGRSDEVVKMLKETGVLLYCLDTNNSGEPKHPLYIPDKQELQCFS
ncbi:hypothetical protein LCGC14_0364280 [marine sediment metagenome]|uniref:DUF1643 domain-containing protein n=1 Tax=marine sediment metagenome TaxID=412755 RepID=A0A0F9TCY4_9ZZZZ